MTTVTASTSVVLVSTSNGASPQQVQFPNISTVGRLVTVRDNDGQASTGNSIIMAPVQGASFADGSSTISINQPFGFVTLLSQVTGAQSVVNTFAFPAGSAAASVSNLQAQNVSVASTLTIYDQVTSFPNVITTSNSQMQINSTIVGEVSALNLQSTVIGLGSAGQLSSLATPTAAPLLVAVGQTSNQLLAEGSTIGSIIQSADGVTWNNVSFTQGFTFGGRGVAFGKGTQVAAGVNYLPGDAANLGNLQWSIDGSNWANSLSPSFTTYNPQAGNPIAQRFGCFQANNLYFAQGVGYFGGPGTILQSSDGKNWNQSLGSPFPSPFGNTGIGQGMAYGKGVQVCVGAQDGQPAVGCALWSQDGSNWNNASSASWSGAIVSDVTFDGNYFYATCHNGTNASCSNLAISLDGKTWTSAGLSGVNTANFNNNAQTGFVTANSNIILVTTNLPNQQLLQSQNSGATFSSNTNLSNSGVLRKPYWDGASWWIGASNATDQNIYTSSDGITWTNVGFTGGFSNGGYPTGFVATAGTGTNALTSTVQGLNNSFTTNQLITSSISSSVITTNLLIASSLIVDVVNVSTQNISVTNISSLFVNTLSTGVITAGSGFINTLSTTFLSTNQLQAGSGNFVTYTANTGQTSTLSTTFLSTNQLQAGSGNFVTQTSQTGSVSTLSTTFLSTNQLQAGSGNFVTYTANTGQTSTLSTTFLSTNQLQAGSGNFITYTANTAQTSTLSTTFLSTNQLQAGSGNFVTQTSQTGSVSTLSTNFLSTNQFNSGNANLLNATANSFTGNAASISSISTNQLSTTYVQTSSINALLGQSTTPQKLYQDPDTGGLYQDV